MEEKKNKPTSKAKSVVDALVIKKLAEISEAIIKTKIDLDKPIKTNYNKFYKIMAKHGIKKYVKTKNGHTGNNFEWTICATLFEKTINDALTWDRILGEVPRKIMY